MTLSSFKTAVSGMVVMRDFFGICLGMLLLSACGGGGETGTAGGTTTPTPLPTAVNYEVLAATATETSALHGVAQFSNGSNGTQFLVASNGQLQHDTGVLTLTSGSYAFTSDTNGFQINGTTTDAFGASIVHNPQLGTGYQYLSVYNGSFQSSGANFDTLGVFGVETASADMPTMGAATMTGEAELVAVSQNAGITFLTDGTATISANFGTGMVSITLNNFTPLAANGTAAASAPFTELNVANMAISDNGFFGGTLTILDGSTPVDVTGTNTVHASHGAFFGFNDTASTPAEIGGVLQVVGDTGVINGIYVAN